MVALVALLLGVARPPAASTVRIELKFAPTGARIAVSGVPEHVTTSGREISWRATHAGGMTINVTAPQGWVIYVGRLRLR